jgi:hypothetical protein
MYSIKVSSSGLVERVFNDSTVSQIVCLNKTNIFPDEKSVVLTDPKHPDSGLGYSAWGNPSSIDGICKIAGYQRGVHNSLRGTQEKYDSIQVDSNGAVVAGPVDHIVNKVVCITNR